MSADASVAFLWGDGEHRFRLAIGQLRELQEKCDAGPAEIFERLRAGRWRVDDVREALRIGLIGGGMKPVEALVLVRRYVDERPLIESVPAALAIVGVALLGAPGDPVGVGKPAAEEIATEATDASSSRPSTAPAAPSAGPLAT